MSRTSIWSDLDILSATIRQLAIDNGMPNVMPTLEQMRGTPGLASWVQTKEGGVKLLSNKLKMVMKPNVLPHAPVEEFTHQVKKGTTVFVHTSNSVHPAIVLEKSKEVGALVVLVLNKNLTRKHVRYGKKSTNRYQWCYMRDMPKNLVTIST